MVTFVVSLLVGLAVTAILSIFYGEVWQYFVPISAFCLLSYLEIILRNLKATASRIIDSGKVQLLDHERVILLGAPAFFVLPLKFRWMKTAIDFSASIGILQVMVSISLLIFLLKSSWILAALSLLILLVSTFGRLSRSFPSHNAEQDLARIFSIITNRQVKRKLKLNAEEARAYAGSLYQGCTNIKRELEDL